MLLEALVFGLQDLEQFCAFSVKGKTYNIFHVAMSRNLLTGKESRLVPRDSVFNPAGFTEDVSVER